VDWLLLAGLGIMWMAFLMPTGRRGHSPHQSVEDFERRMELLAQAEAQGTSGRWIVTPRKGARFVGTAERRRARARGRRKQVFTFLLESIGLSFLIGLVPPLRSLAWGVTMLLGLMLLLYVWLLLAMKHRSSTRPAHETARAARAPATPAPQAPAARYVAEGRSTWARPTFNGLGTLGESDRVHVVVRTADPAGA
jgi:Flp pilus assembly protein TadB